MSRSTESAEPQDADSRGAPRTELALPGVLLGAGVTVGAFVLLAVGLSTVSANNAAIPNYSSWFADVPRDPIARLQWIVGDITEPQFYKSWIASLGLLLGATIGWMAWRAGRRWAGTPIAYGSGLWPWMLGAASLSLVLSNLGFGGNLERGPAPTFVPFVCVATSVVLIYGSGWATLLTGAVLGVVTTPLAMVLIEHTTQPLDLPPVVANTTSMSLGAATAFLVCRALPWMSRAEPETPPTGEQHAEQKRPQNMLSDLTWTVRRILTDFTETQFYANEWASAGLLGGIVLTSVLNPEFASYGTELLPRILCAQALTSAVGVVLWRHLYRDGGWAPTYVSVVSVAPATVLAYGDSLTAIVLGAVAGAVLCPVIARPVSGALPSDFHPFIGNTVAMAISTASIVPTIGLVT